MCTGIEILQIAATVMGTMQAQQAADEQKRIAEQQALANYETSKRNAEAKYAETNRQLAEKQGEKLAEESEAIRKANEAMGTFRAAETALSDGSFANLLFEQSYGEGLQYATINDNYERAFDASVAEKKATEINYVNETNMAANQAQNAIAKANASADQALMGGISSGLSIGAGYYNRQATLAAAKGTTVPENFLTKDYKLFG
jgi:membrane protein involved in colicin uptake